MYQRIPRRPYRGYGNNKRKKRFILLTVLLGLCILVVSAFFLLQNYLVFTKDGVRLELPFSTSKKVSNKTSDDSNETPLKIEPKDSTKTQSPSTETTPPNGTENKEGTVLNAVYADVSKLSDSNYRKTLLSLPGVNAIVIDLKLPDGRMTYPSKAAVEGTVINASNAVPMAVKEFSENGIYVIGRMSAFRDNIAPRTTMRTSALKTKSGAVWLDYKSMGWFNPNDTGTQQYLSALALEASQMGVNELQFYNFCFPTLGKTGMINYSNVQDKTSAVNQIYNQIGTALSGSKTVLSVMAEDSALETGKDANAGQDISALSKQGRIYFNASDNTAALLDSAKWDQFAAGAFNEGKIVPVLKTSSDKNPLAPLAKDTIDKCGFVLMNTSGEYTVDNLGK